MKRISRNLTAAALTGALALAGITAAHAEEGNSQDTNTSSSTGTQGDNGSSEQGGDQGSSNEGDQGSSDKDGSSADLKGKLSSEDGKPTDLGIAAIVLGVVGALAAIGPAAAQALGIKLPF